MMIAIMMMMDVVAIMLFLFVNVGKKTPLRYKLYKVALLPATLASVYWFLNQVRPTIIVNANLFAFIWSWSA